MSTQWHDELSLDQQFRGLIKNLIVDLVSRLKAPNTAERDYYYQNRKPPIDFINTLLEMKPGVKVTVEETKIVHELARDYVRAKRKAGYHVEPVWWEFEYEYGLVDVPGVPPKMELLELLWWDRVLRIEAKEFLDNIAPKIYRQRDLDTIKSRINQTIEKSHPLVVNAITNNPESFQMRIFAARQMNSDDYFGGLKYYLDHSKGDYKKTYEQFLKIYKSLESFEKIESKHGSEILNQLKTVFHQLKRFRAELALLVYDHEENWKHKDYGDPQSFTKNGPRPRFERQLLNGELPKAFIKYMETAKVLLENLKEKLNKGKKDELTPEAVREINDEIEKFKKALAKIENKGINVQFDTTLLAAMTTPQPEKLSSKKEESKELKESADVKKDKPSR